MKNVWIAKSAIVTGLGDNLQKSWEGLIKGRTAIGPIRRFDIGRLPYHQAACVDLGADDTENQICVLMEQALAAIGPVPPETFVIWTGIKGSVPYIESKEGEKRPFLPVHYRHWVADRAGIANGGIEINAACAASTVGLAIGGQKIALGEQTSVLVCAADLVSAFVHRGFSSLKALTATACRPFDRRRDGMCLGDGAVAVLLTDTATAHKVGSRHPVRLAGWGISNDATHITAPTRDGSGLAAAIGAALDMAGVDPDEVGAFCAHGTGTRHNDHMELAAIGRVFGSRRFPVFSVKGSIGHTLGAAGGIETAICRLALQHKIIPPTVGVEDPETAARGSVRDGMQTFGGRNILTTNSGFGGVNAALLLQDK